MTFNFRKPSGDFTRERVIDGQRSVRPDRRRDEESPEVQDLPEIAKRAKDVRRKAQVLREAIANAAENQTIPVAEKDRSVRAAVQRLLGGTDGSAIPFSLWARLVNDPHEKSERVPLLDLAPDLTGDVLTDSYTLTEYVEDNDPLWPYISQMLVILAANRLMGAFSAPDRARMTAPKLPPGAELPELVHQLAIAYGTYQAVQGIENFAGLQQSQLQFLDNETVDKVKDQVQSALLEGGLDSSLPSSNFEADRNTIMNYGMSWLSTTEKEGYEGWMRYPYIRKLETNMGHLSEADSLWTEAVGAARLAVDVPKDLLRGFVCDLEKANQALDRAATSLRSRYATEALCCLTKVLTELGVKIGDNDFKFLKTIKVFLRMFLVVSIGLSIKNIFKAELHTWESFMRKKYNRALTIVLRRFYANFAEPMLQFLNREEWELLRACLPFDELIEFILKAMEDIDKTIKTLMQGLYLDQEDTYTTGYQLDEQLPMAQRARSMINLIESLESAIRSGILDCRNNQGGTKQTIRPEELVNVTSRVEADRPPLIELPPPTGNPYMDFNPVTWETSGMVVPAPSRFAPDAEPSIAKIVTDCMRRVPSELVPVANELKEL